MAFARLSDYVVGKMLPISDLGGCYSTSPHAKYFLTITYTWSCHATVFNGRLKYIPPRNRWEDLPRYFSTTESSKKIANRVVVNIVLSLNSVSLSFIRVLIPDLTGQKYLDLEGSEVHQEGHDVYLEIPRSTLRYARSPLRDPRSTVRDLRSTVRYPRSTVETRGRP